MESLEGLLKNYVLIVALSSWISAQVLKTIIYLIVNRKLNLERLSGAGGMPSAHSASVCGITIAISRTVGVADPLFALSFMFAAVVMYDAMGVRRAAGQHASVINKLVKDHDKEHINNLDALKEFLGHTPFEVLGGAMLGILIAMVIPVS